MRKLLALLLFFFAIPCFAQGFRVGDDHPITGVLTSGGPIFSVPNAGISFCTSPANAVPCTNKAVTYTDITLGTPCSSSTQVVLIGSTSCVGTTDAYGNWGAWVAAGNYAFTVALPGGGYAGPYPVTIPSSGAGSVSNVSFNQSPCLAPLFSCTVTNPATTPVLSFTQSNAAPSTLFSGPQTGSAAPPSFLPTVSLVNAGKFVGPTMNEYMGSLVGGCSPITILNTGGSALFNTDAIDACLKLPAAGTPTVALSNALAAYAENDNTTSGGPFGGAVVNALYAQAWCTVGSPAECEGVVASAVDQPGQSGTLLVGTESDVSVSNNSTRGYGILSRFAGNGQPTANNYPGYGSINFPGTTGRFTSMYSCAPDTVVIFGSNGEPCVFVDKVSATAGLENSQLLLFKANNGAADFFAQFFLTQNGYFDANVPQVQSVGSVEGYGIQLGSTNNVSVNELVKIDTAHADSIVPCTTSDTSCDGFVEDQLGSGAGGFCNAGSQFCGLITTTGSKVQGVLGTGTCSIGQNVIVDTTTNGRVKCTGSTPAQGAWIGKALSAQSTVGMTVDVLTKFQ